MTFENVAKSLISKTKIQEISETAAPSHTGGTPEPSNARKARHLRALANAGFSPEETCEKLQDLYNECTEDEKGVKRQILDMIVKMNGMLIPDDIAVRQAPSFNLIIQGDNIRVNQMLCPSFETAGGN